MTRVGRKPAGPRLVDRLDGSAQAKQRLRAILAALGGSRTIPEVCRELGIGETMFHKLRDQTLRAALARLEPQPMGRPPRSSQANPQRITELESELRRLKLELTASQAREQIAATMPHLVARRRPVRGRKKKRARSRAE